MASDTVSNANGAFLAGRNPARRPGPPPVLRLPAAAPLVLLPPAPTLESVVRTEIDSLHSLLAQVVAIGDLIDALDGAQASDARQHPVRLAQVAEGCVNSIIDALGGHAIHTRNVPSRTAGRGRRKIRLAAVAPVEFNRLFDVLALIVAMGDLLVLHYPVDTDETMMRHILRLTEVAENSVNAIIDALGDYV